MQDEALQSWMDRYSNINWYWYVKRLSGNDTLLNGTHQAGPYIPKDVINVLVPSIRQSTELNPRKNFEVSIDSHKLEASVTAIWYNNRIIGSGTRNECRITNWGGRNSPILDPESTGSIFILAFHKTEQHDADDLRVWLCTDIDQEDLIENRIGPVEPGVRVFIIHSKDKAETRVTYDEAQKPSTCALEDENIPGNWLDSFPSAMEIVQMSIRLRPARNKLIDERLMERRSCEYDIFLAVEKTHVLPKIFQGFNSVVEFLELANSVANRRKSRAGKSLELQTKAIFDEENITYAHGEISEMNKRPDFLFPSIKAYRSNAVSENRLKMLAVKTTCKDRWRQILNEADKIKQKHLLTIQEGISENQFEEMQQAGVILVVPSTLHKFYIPRIRERILSLESFITELRTLT